MTETYSNVVHGIHRWSIRCLMAMGRMGAMLRCLESHELLQ